MVIQIERCCVTVIHRVYPEYIASSEKMVDE
jgi:hypothetical protein